MDNKRKRTGKEIKSSNEDIDDLQKKLNTATAEIRRLEE
jgi:peptidoglycan hydrolase CwlO-like protein